jgi:c(7)-type cytochrome triheme protein
VKRIFLPLFIFGILLFSGLALGRIGGGNIAFKPQKAKPLTFSHDSPVEDLGFACQKCYPSLYVTKEKAKSVTMAAIGRGKSCGS